MGLQNIFLETVSKRYAKNLAHLTLPEVKDFCALRDARCFWYVVKGDKSLEISEIFRIRTLRNAAQIDIIKVIPCGWING